MEELLSNIREAVEGCLSIELGLEITPQTTIPLWEGERMVAGMAIEGLLQLE